jgi:nitrite reductase/ring-hydroxylating ferredoxin subunit
MTSRDACFVVCPSDRLSNGQHLKLQLVFEALREECIVFRFDGEVYAYLNRCVHMPRKLDCEQNQVFDKSGRFLRCSMHGIVYQPETGASVSTICEGERLRAVALREEGGEIRIVDFRVSSVLET